MPGPNVFPRSALVDNMDRNGDQVVLKINLTERSTAEVSNEDDDVNHIRYFRYLYFIITRTKLQWFC